LYFFVAVSLICCIWSDIYRAYFDPKTSNNHQGYLLWEQWLAQATAPHHAIYLNFDFPDAGKSAGFAQTIYFLGNYWLYPQRVLVADPSIPIGEGHDILKNNSYPGDRWLLDHDVLSVMTIIMDEQRQLPYVKSVRWLGASRGTESRGG
jgi:hypothetical protein